MVSQDVKDKLADLIGSIVTSAMDDYMAELLSVAKKPIPKQVITKTVPATEIASYPLVTADLTPRAPTGRRILPRGPDKRPRASHRSMTDRFASIIKAYYTFEGVPSINDISAIVGLNSLTTMKYASHLCTSGHLVRVSRGIYTINLSNNEVLDIITS